MADFRADLHGYYCVPNQVTDREDLTAQEKAVLALSLYRRANEKGECWPSRATIAKDTSTSISSVKRTLKSLEEKGLVQRESRRTEEDRQTSNVYRLRTRVIVNMVPACEAVAGPQGGHDEPEGAPSGPEEGATLDPEVQPIRSTTQRSTKPHCTPSVHDVGKYPSWFEELWAAYPRKTGKKAAYRCCRARIKQGMTEEQLIAASKNYAAGTNGREQRLIKLGATFFGRDEWCRDFVDRVPEGEHGGGNAVSQHCQAVKEAFARMEQGMEETFKDAPWNKERENEQ